MKRCANLIAGKWEIPAGVEFLSVDSPYLAQPCASVPLSRAAQIAATVAAAEKAFPGWRALSMKERVRPLLRLRALFERDLQALAAVISAESGKTPTEAVAELEKGIEVMDFALALPNFPDGGEMEVSRGITCAFRREPLGVVAGITPFNFPAMVALWMIPNALTLGNCFIWKPSEKVSQTPQAIGELFREAGYPDGVFSIVNGDRHTVEALCDHAGISALGFVGSSTAARAVYQRATAAGKRALCLGGAKNHLILLPDADRDAAARSIVDSFTGCAGQRCMAGSVLVAVGDCDSHIEAIHREAGARRLGVDIGTLIDQASRLRLLAEIEKAVARGVRLRLDGRQAAAPSGFAKGAWLAPCILEPAQNDDPCVKQELFGPLLTIVHVATLDEALALERQSPYGNATVVFTRDGGAARHVAEAASTGMVGINVGIPVPREPFSFGGRKKSKFGSGDITGEASLSLWSDLKKITTKWTEGGKASGPRDWLS